MVSPSGFLLDFLIIVALQVSAVKIYPAIVEALKKKER
jgi:hypothetical protein